MFQTKLAVLKESNTHWRVLKPLLYDDGRYRFEVPVGFLTDFASVPRIPFVFSVFGDKAHACATLHDYLYHIRHPREEADKVFFAALKSDPEISKWKALVMYKAVRIFGKYFYPGGSP